MKLPIDQVIYEAEKNGRYIPLQIRNRLKDQKHCSSCKKKEIKKKQNRTIDHIKPLWAGGKTEEKNLWTICRDSHALKNKWEEELKKNKIDVSSWNIEKWKSSFMEYEKNAKIQF